MSVLGRVHEGYVLDRLVELLATHLAELLPRAASVLDVGCGDGSLAKRICDRRPDVQTRGIDVLLR
jgi:16S rRNA G1207 methylase RsmC